MSRARAGSIAVLERRLEALKGAIERQNQFDTEFIYDMVLRAFHKLVEDGWDTELTEVEPLKAAAAETDTFSFQITNMRFQDKELTISTEALNATGDQIKAWVAARIMHHWQATGIAPKFVNVEVKVGLE